MLSQLAETCWLPHFLGISSLSATLLLVKVAAMAQERVAMLARHLVSAQPTELPEFDPKEVYLFLTRDNVELRKRMLEHLKVCCLC